MSIQNIDNFEFLSTSNNRNKLIDNRQGVYDTNVWRPYNSISEALSLITSGKRARGLIINVLIDDINKWYYFRNGIADNDLVPFLPLVNIGTDSTGVGYSDNKSGADYSFVSGISGTGVIRYVNSWDNGTLALNIQSGISYTNGETILIVQSPTGGGDEIYYSTAVINSFSGDTLTLATDPFQTVTIDPAAFYVLFFNPSTIAAFNTANSIDNVGGFSFGPLSAASSGGLSFGVFARCMGFNSIAMGWNGYAPANKGMGLFGKALGANSVSIWGSATPNGITIGSLCSNLGDNSFVFGFIASCGTDKGLMFNTRNSFSLYNSDYGVSTGRSTYLTNANSKSHCSNRFNTSFSQDLAGCQQISDYLVGGETVGAATVDLTDDTNCNIILPGWVHYFEGVINCKEVSGTDIAHYTISGYCYLTTTSTGIISSNVTEVYKTSGLGVSVGTIAITYAVKPLDLSTVFQLIIPVNGHVGKTMRWACSLNMKILNSKTV